MKHDQILKNHEIKHTRLIGIVRDIDTGFQELH